MLHIKQIISGLTLFALSLAPSFALARLPEPDKGLIKPAIGTSNTSPAGFCTRASNVRGELMTKLTAFESNRGDKRQNTLDELSKRRSERIDQVQTRRDEAKDKFERALGDLEDEPELTDAKKQAISDFKAAVSAANTTRKTAVDAAVKTFRDAVHQLVTQREDAVKGAAATFKASVQAAVDKAKADCSVEGANGTTLRQTLMASIKAAHEKFRADIASADKIKGNVEALAKSRNEVIRAANQTFKEAVQKAKLELKNIMVSS